MASTELRPAAGQDPDDPNATGSWRVYWRMGGRGGPKQSVTTSVFTRVALIKAFVEDRGHRVSDTEVYAALFPREQVDTTTPTLAVWLGMWAEVKHGDVQADTLEKYLATLRRWVVPRLGGLRLTEISTEEIREWVLWMRKQTSARSRPVSDETVRRVHSILHQALAAAVPKYIGANPAAKVAGSRRGSTGLPKHRPYEATFLLPEELDLILPHVCDAIRDMVITAAYTGLRLGELVGLRVMDVSLGTNPELHVRRAVKAGGVIGYPKSERSRRTVSLSGDTVAALKPRVEGRAKMAPVFTSPTGLIWDKDNVREQHWRRAVAAAQRCPDHMPPAPPKPARGRARGLRPDEVSTCDCDGRLHKTPRFHDLRHTHASWLIAAKWDLVTISRRLGHESTATTSEIYAHLFPHGDADGLAALDRLRG